MADVGLILEGTYPYVTGGVSGWVHDIITDLKDVTFDLVAIVPSRGYTREYKYKMPPNVYSIKNIYLNDLGDGFASGAGYFSRAVFFKKLYDALLEVKSGNYEAGKEVIALFKKYSPSVSDFMKSSEGWDFFVKIYNRFDKTLSFLDFFWTMRFVMVPLLNIMRAEAPECHCYHPVSTGYAGLLGSIFKMTTGKGLILTEHGIYANERLLEIVDARWIYDENQDEMDAMKELSPLKQFWITLFMIISSVTYHNSDKIITLYRGNQHLQIKHGADVKKCSIIPNGIDVQKFGKKRVSASEGPEYKVGFVGRIVPIKDVKSLLHAARFVVDRLPGAKFDLKGPYDEDKAYYEECRILVSLLSLDQNVFFTGPSDVSAFYKDLDVLVLSSVSEAQPLSLLEANLCAVPVVSTDVGAVRELLYGIDEEDMRLGPSGVVVPVKSPQALGEEIVKLLSNRDLNNKMGAAGVKRVLSYYKKEDLMTKYRDIYKGFIK